MEEAEYEGFSIREYTRNVRSVDIQKCCPFSGEFNGEFTQSLLPPLTVTKFRWWSHELTSLLTKSPDDPKPAFRPKVNAESSPCKKRSIDETTTNELVLHKKKIKTKKPEDSFNAKTDNKVNNPSLHYCCSQMNRLSLCSAAEDQSPKVIAKDKTSDNMLLESRQVNKVQHVVSERRLSHARAESVLSSFPGPHLTLERIKHALDLERKRHVSPQPIQSSISTSSEIHYRSYSSSMSQPVSLLSHSPFESLLVEEAISGSPLPLQGEEANGCSRSAAAENGILLSNLVDLSSGRKHSAETALARDVGMHNEKHHMYYPARLGLDETFTENAFFVLDANDGECDHTINLQKQEALSSRNMVTNSDGLCLQNIQSTMRLMGKDVSVKTGYSDMVRRGEKIIASDPCIDYSFLESYAQQSWLWQATTLEENHPITSLETPLPMFCEPPQVRTHVVPDSELPPTLLYPCGSLLPCPLTDKDLYYHESSLGQQLNSVTFSQEELPFPYNPEITGLQSNYSNVSVGCLLPDVRDSSFELRFTSTTQSQLPWPQSSFESSRLDMSSINPSELN